jgi:hypothetical protein
MIVKCKLCGTPHEKTETYTPTGKSPYYCSQEEYDEDKLNKTMRKSTYILLHDDILNYDERQIITNKKLEELGKSYGWEVVFKTFKHCENDIKFWINQKDFKSEYYKLTYLMAIISNNINDIYMKHKKEKIKKETNTYVDINLLNDEVVPNKVNTNDISQFL